MIWKLFKPNIEKLKGKGNTKRLIKTLRDNDIELRRKAASALGEIGSEESVEPLIQLLGDSDVELRRITVSALGEIADENAVESLIQLLDDSDIELRKSVVSALVEFIKKKEKGDIYHVIKILKSGDIELRRRAASALGEIGDEESVEPLIHLLGDSDVELRKRAVFALGKIGDEKAVGPLIQLLGDTNIELRRIAVSVLGMIGDNKAVEPLIQLLDDSDIELRKSVVSALVEFIKKLKEKGDINHVIKILRSNDIELQGRAIIALGEIADDKAVESLIQLLGDGDVELRKKAVFALGEIVNRVGAEKAIETICERIDYGKLKTLGFKKTFEESLLLDFQKICERCQKHSVHKYYVKKLRVFHSDDLVYNEEFGYIKCDNCGRTSKPFSSKEEIVDIIIEPKTINKINSIIQEEGLIKLPEHATFFDFIQLMEEIEQSGRAKIIIDVIRRIKSQVIDGVHNRCFYCGKRVYPAMGKLCSVCNLIVCDEHILPEKHGCKGTNIPPSGYAISRMGKVTSQEGTLSSEEGLSGY